MCRISLHPHGHQTIRPSLGCTLPIKRTTRTHIHTIILPHSSPTQPCSVSCVGEWGWMGPYQTRQSGSEPPQTIQHDATRLHACIRTISHRLQQHGPFCPMTRQETSTIRKQVSFVVASRLASLYNPHPPRSLESFTTTSHIAPPA